MMAEQAETGMSGALLPAAEEEEEERALASMEALEGLSFPVVLDVGGVAYKASAVTLSKSPTLAALIGLKGSATELFVDRDGEPFRWVLSFLRTRRLEKLPSRAACEAVLCEARFYEVHDLVAVLEKRLEPEPVKPWWFRVYDFARDHYGKAFLVFLGRFLFKQLKKGAKTIGNSQHHDAATTTTTLSISANHHPKKH